MTKENLNKVQTKESPHKAKQNLELEAYEVESSTVLEEMGASFSVFGNSCSTSSLASN